MIKLPKRLAALLALLTLISTCGLIAQQGVLFCILTLFMVVAVLGRQKAALVMLRVYSVMQLVLVSLLPIAPDAMGKLITSSEALLASEWLATLPDTLIFSLLIFIGMVQVWVAFNVKVKRYFNREMNLNLMS